MCTGRFWTKMGVFGQKGRFWTKTGVFGQKWAFLDKNGRFWTKQALFGKIQNSLCPKTPILSKNAQKGVFGQSTILRNLKGVYPKLAGQSALTDLLSNTVAPYTLK